MSSRGPVQVRLLDGTAEGRFDRRWSIAPGPRNSRATQVLFGSGSARDGTRVAQCLAEAQSVGGRLYRFTPTAAGDHLTVAPYRGAVGTIGAVLLPSPGATLTFSVDLVNERGFRSEDVSASRERTTLAAALLDASGTRLAEADFTYG